ncbi:MAG: homocysteine S-methyltransferase family protein, partial [Fibrobacteria bacterium]|nr:homocysteine S-methyltransferase family protein [Fibrobacteria bacterium]
MKIEELPIIVFDGACGTNIQNMDISTELWEGNEGCNELLNVTAADKIIGLHRSFYEAGSHVVETNTFGANLLVLSEYGLEERVREINTKAVENARKASEGLTNKFVAGSIGPGTKLPSLGHIAFEELVRSYTPQVESLMEAGVDCLILETCQDLLQVKAALYTIQNVFDSISFEVPILVSITIEQTGTMLTGSDIGAVVATLQPYGLFSLGLNCATGPSDMQSHLRYLSEYWEGRISCIPNAGLPVVEQGKTVYPLQPESFSLSLQNFVEDLGISVVGGCCGTTPEHMQAATQALEKSIPANRKITPKAQVSSLYQAVDIVSDPPPLLIGERANTNGSKKFKELLSQEDFEGCLNVGMDQEKAGAPIVDLCTAYVGRDELSDITRLTTMFSQSVKSGMVLDTTTPECIEAGLRLYPGRLIVNSVNLEDGGSYLAKVVKMVKRFGCAVIALSIHEKGQAMTSEEKFETAKRIHALAVDKYGLHPGDLFFDPLTFPIGTGSEDLVDAGIQTIEAIRRIKRELPGVFTVIGLSNVSFGLPPASRKILNSVFLHECVKAGLDSAIVDAKKIIPIAKIDEHETELCLNLIYNRTGKGSEKPLDAYISYFNVKKDTGSDDQKEAVGEAHEQRLASKLINGEKEGVEDLITILLKRYKALTIINNILVPAMKVVGDLFGKGEMLLPFVLQSAETMKLSVSVLEPYMEKIEGEDDTRLKVLLATVQGDVHDIGKNLVDIILSNNGYKVYNIGIKVPAEQIIEKAREFNVDIIGLSGLLVKSALVMKASLPQYAQSGLTTPILLGGAALTKKFVATECVPLNENPVVYCRDAFAGLKACNDFAEGKLKATSWDVASERKTVTATQNDVDVIRDNPVPNVPFTGYKHVTDIDVAPLFDYINEQALFRGRWGYRRAKLGAEEYKELIATKVRPMY